MKKLILLTALISLSFVAQAYYEPTIVRDDRIWTYCFEYHFYSETTQKFLNCKFDGTEQHGDYTYHRLKYWYENESESTAQTVALMREDRRGVYILLEQTSINAGNVFNQDVIIPENTEAILYDFYAETGDIKTRIMDCKEFTEHEYDTGSPLRMTPAFTLGTFEYMNLPSTINGRNYQVYEMGSIDDPCFGNYLDHSSSLSICDLGIYAREVGNIGRGLLHYMSMSPMSTGMVYTNCYFVRQTDSAGNVLFDTAWLDNSLGIKSPDAETSNSANGKCYDLSGGQVENPESGTIYIRDGKKHIAR